MVGGGVTRRTGYPTFITSPKVLCELGCARWEWGGGQGRHKGDLEARCKRLTALEALNPKVSG